MYTIHKGRETQFLTPSRLRSPHFPLARGGRRNINTAGSEGHRSGTQTFTGMGEPRCSSSRGRDGTSSNHLANPLVGVGVSMSQQQVFSVHTPTSFKSNILR
jgi:hypothetical protein